MKKAYFSVALFVLCFATLANCLTAAAESRSPLIFPNYPAPVSVVASAPKAAVAPRRRSFPTLQAILGQWRTNGSLYYSLNSRKIDRTGQTNQMGKTSQAVEAGQTVDMGQAVGTSQTAKMQAPLKWLDAMTLRLTANRQILTEFLGMTGHGLSSEWIYKKDHPLPRD